MNSTWTQGSSAKWSRHGVALLLLVSIWAAGLGSRPAGAQALAFQQPPLIGDRKVVLRWNPVPGDTLTTAVRRARLDRLFAGYQIWRASFQAPDHFELMRTYSLFDSTWTFRGTERAFADPDSIVTRGCTGIPDISGGFVCDPITGKALAPFNGFFYYYSITWFEASRDTVGGSLRVTPYQMQTPEEGRLVTPVEPAAGFVAHAPLVGHVTVVPNPFNPADSAHRLQFGDENRISFIGLPSPSTVRIFTAGGDLVRVLENEDDNDTADWNLKNEGGEDIVSGIYLFQVEAASGSLTKTGHFVVVR